MKKFPTFLLLESSVLLFLLINTTLNAHGVIFSQARDNLGVNAPGGLMGIAWGDWDSDSESGVYFYSIKSMRLY